MHVEKKELTVEQCKDSGLALVLICLICYLIWKQQSFILLAIVFLLLAMTYPPVLRPFAKFWFALSTALGTVVSRILLSLLFFGLVFPVGLIRRALGKDSMQIKSWKKGAHSVFRDRTHGFAAEDMEHPY